MLSLASTILVGWIRYIYDIYITYLVRIPKHYISFPVATVDFINYIDLDVIIRWITFLSPPEPLKTLDFSREEALVVSTLPSESTGSANSSHRLALHEIVLLLKLLT